MLPDYPKAILGRWQGFWMTSELPEINEALDIALDYIGKKSIAFLVSDCTKLETIETQITTEVLINTWYPKAHKVGLLYEILIDSEDFMGQISLDSLISEVEETESKVKVFKVETIEAALQAVTKLTEKYFEE